MAFIVCDALGLDSGGYSFPYVTRWAEGSTEVLRETAERVIGCAKEILSGLGEEPGGGAEQRPETHLLSLGPITVS